MGNAQNINMELTTQSQTREYRIQNATLTWGKFYDAHKNDEKNADWVNEKKFKRNSSTRVNACGRNDTSSGTEGTIEIVGDGLMLGRIYWNCPWLSGTSNTIRVDDKRQGYFIEVGNYATSGPEIGYVQINVGKID